MLSRLDDSDISEQASVTRQLLAVTYEALGQFDKAALLYGRAADGYQLVYGPESQEYLMTATIAANTWNRRHDWRGGVGGGACALHTQLFSKRMVFQTRPPHYRSSKKSCTIL